MGLDTKIYWLTDRQSQCNFDFDFDYNTFLRRRLEEWEFGVRWSPACEEVSPEAKVHSLLKDVTKQSSEDRD
jgi:hypothetical protein